MYSSWQELESQVGTLTSGATKIAMQYSPRNAIMYVSMVDAGTVEMVRGLGKEVVSSADLVSRFEAVLNDDQIARTTSRSRRSTPCSQRDGRRLGAGAGRRNA